jgi:hypothetical protein
VIIVTPSLNRGRGFEAACRHSSTPRASGRSARLAVFRDEYPGRIPRRRKSGSEAAEVSERRAFVPLSKLSRAAR